MALAAVFRSLKSPNVIQFSRNISPFLTQPCYQNCRKTTSIFKIQNKYFVTEKKAWITGKSGSPFEPQHPKERISKTSPEIVLISDGNISKITLESAEKLAKRRNLKLVKIVDFNIKTTKPTYKLMSTSEYFQEEVKAKQQRAKERLTHIKDEKLITMSSKIAEHDLDLKIHQIGKLLKKRHQVRIMITHDGSKERGMEMIKSIEMAIKNVASVQQKSSKQTSSKITLIPTMQTQETTNDTQEDIKEENKTENIEKDNETEDIKGQTESTPISDLQK